MVGYSALAIAALAVIFYVAARGRAVSAVSGVLKDLHSRPSYHGVYAAAWTLLAGWGVLLVAGVAVTMWIDGMIAAEALRIAPDLEPLQRELLVRDATAMAKGLPPSRVDALREQLAAFVQGWGETRALWLSVAAVGAAVLAGLSATLRAGRDFRARNRSESMFRILILVCASIAVITTIGIVLALVGETLIFASTLGDAMQAHEPAANHPDANWRLDKFLFGTTWSPLGDQREGFVDPDKIGWVPILAGSLMITFIALLVAVPVGLLSAVYLSDYASPSVRAVAKPLLEILAGIPTVVYGFFAAVTVAPVIRNFAESIGFEASGQSALAAGVVMGVMIIPFISSLSDDVINAVPQSLRDASLGLGATKAETIRTVILPAALPGIISSVILGFSRAIGETMIVVMAAGQGPNLTWNPLESMTTVTVQIVMLIVGDSEAALAAGPAFTLGFALFTVTLILNIIALRIVRRYRELYD